MEERMNLRPVTPDRFAEMALKYCENRVRNSAAPQAALDAAVSDAAEKVYYEAKETGVLYETILRFPLRNSDRMVLRSLQKNLNAACSLLYLAMEKLSPNEYCKERFGQEKYRFSHVAEALTYAEQRHFALIERATDFANLCKDTPGVRESVTAAAAILIRMTNQLAYLGARNHR